MRRVRRRVRLRKKNLIRIPEGLEYGTVSWWMAILKAASDKKKRNILLVEESCKREVEDALSENVADLQQAVYDQVTMATRIQHGDVGNPVTHIMWPKLKDITIGIRSFLADNVTYIDWNTKKGRWVAGEWTWAGELPYPEYPEGSRVLVFGALNRTVIHIKGLVKVLVMPVPEELRGTVTLLEEGGEERRRWREMGPWATSGDLEFFLRGCEDEELMMLYGAHRSCHEIQRELIRRAQAMDIEALPEGLRPRVSWAQIGRILNAKYRRALMTVGIVHNYPAAIAVDDEGELYPLSTHVQVLKLTCPSTGRVYHLGVPVVSRSGGVETEIRTPRQARRWTLGLPEGAEIMAET